jgi:multicomponent Na+:H+ antiporter subunit E
VTAPMSGSIWSYWLKHPARNLLLIGWFVVLWSALWGSFTWANLLGGAAVAIGVLTVAPLPMTGLESRGTGRLRPLWAMWFLVYFAVKVVQSNVMLAWEVVTPRNSIKPGIMALDLRDCSDAVVTLIANALTLTPGSVTIEVRRKPTTIYVHVLHLNDQEKVRAEMMAMAKMAIRAFGSAEALEQFSSPQASRFRVIADDTIEEKGGHQ